MSPKIPPIAIVSNASRPLLREFEHLGGVSVHEKLAGLTASVASEREIEYFLSLPNGIAIRKRLSCTLSPIDIVSNLLREARLSIDPKEVLKEIVTSWSRNCLRFNGPLATAPKSMAYIFHAWAPNGGAMRQAIQHARFFKQYIPDICFIGDLAETPPLLRKYDIRYLYEPSETRRFSKLDFDVIVLGSVFQETFLNLINPHSQCRVLHLCQGNEGRMLGEQSFDYFTDKPIVRLLHQMPLTRIVVSSSLQHYFQVELEQKAHLVENSISEGFFQQVKAPLGTTPSHDLKILSVGNFHVLKDKETLFEAIRLGMQSNLFAGKVSVTLVSPSKLETSHRDMIDRQPCTVTVIEQSDEATIQSLMQSHDVLVNSSLYEGFGLPSIEAMAMGLPVIQARNEGLDDYLASGLNCLQYEPGNAHMLAKALQSVSLNEPMFERIKTLGKITAEQFTEANQSNQIRELYEHVLSPPQLKLISTEKAAITVTCVVTYAGSRSLLDQTLNSIALCEADDIETLVIIPPGHEQGFLESQVKYPTFRWIQKPDALGQSLVSLSEHASGNTIVCIEPGICVTAAFFNEVRGRNTESAKVISRFVFNAIEMANGTLQTAHQRAASVSQLLRMPETLLLYLMSSDILPADALIFSKRVAQTWAERATDQSEYYFILDAIRQGRFELVTSASGVIMQEAVQVLALRQQALHAIKARAVQNLIAQHTFEALFPLAESGTAQEKASLIFSSLHSSLRGDSIFAKYLPVDVDFLQCLVRYVRERCDPTTRGLALRHLTEDFIKVAKSSALSGTVKALVQKLADSLSADALSDIEESSEKDTECLHSEHTFLC